MTPIRNIHIECNPNETPIRAIRNALHNMKPGEITTIERFTLASGQELPVDVTDDLVAMSSNDRVYMTWVEHNPWQVKLHVLYAENIDNPDYMEDA